MKILQVSNFLAPVHGGSAEVPWQISRALAGRRHHVSIYTSNFKLDPNSLPAAGVDIHAFKSWLRLATFDITPGMIKTARQEIKGFDIIHLHNYRTYQNIVAHHYAKKYGIPYMLQAHGSLTTYFQKGALKKVFDIAWGRKILEDAAKVLAVTGAEAEQYRSLGVSENKIEIVPHGIDLAEFGGRTVKGEFRKKYKIDGDRKIILYLGRIHKMKGLDILAAAFADLSRRRQDIKLVIAGPDDGYLPVLKKLTANLGIDAGVVFTGPLYGQKKLQAYADTDIYVLPSSYEIFGITILEAWACGKPVIVTDRCGLADLVEGRAGLVVPYDNVQLGSALARMLDDAPMRQEFGRQGKKLVQEQYNWPDIAARVERIYDSVLSDRKRGVGHGRK